MNLVNSVILFLTFCIFSTLSVTSLAGDRVVIVEYGDGRSTDLDFCNTIAFMSAAEDAESKVRVTCAEKGYDGVRYLRYETTSDENCEKEVKLTALCY